MKFQTIICDCPWMLSDRLRMSDVKRGAESNYPVLSVDELCKLPVNELADPNGCVLGLWVLGSMLEDGLKVMKSWGFEQKQVYVWVKTKKEKSLTDIALKDTVNTIKLLKNEPKQLLKKVIDHGFKVGDWLLSFGMGRLFRQSHEICLIGINNTEIYTQLENKSQRSVCFEENKGHSVKPNHLHKSLEIMFPLANKLEIFARKQREGWTTIGHAVSDGEDIKESITRLTGHE